MRRLSVLAAVVCLVATAGFLDSAGAGTDLPDAFTTYTGTHSITYDNDGSPVQASLTLKGLPVASGYKLCIQFVTDTLPSYNDYQYGTQCKTFDFGTDSASTVKWGTNFPWGGPAEYLATWYVPPTGDAVATDTFRWAFKGDGDLSPCPPDPYLQKGVWVPSRHTIIHRCKTWQSAVARNATTGSADGDWDWKINYTNGSTRQVEYMIRDIGRLRPDCPFDCSPPHIHETWKITGVYVCDTYHGWYEFHPVFEAQEIVSGSVTRTLLSGPQYSTKVWQGPYPTFQPHSCS